MQIPPAEPESSSFEQVLETLRPESDRTDALEGGEARLGAETVANLVGVTGRQVDRMREAGVLPPAGGKGKRTSFSPGQVVRLMLIMQAKRAGASAQHLEQLVKRLDHKMMQWIMYRLFLGVEQYLLWDFRDTFDVMSSSDAEPLLQISRTPWFVLCINNVAEQVYQVLGREADAAFLVEQRAKWYSAMNSPEARAGLVEFNRAHSVGDTKGEVRHG